MPTSIDRSDDSDDAFALVEAAEVAARETVPVDRPADDRPTEVVDVPMSGPSRRRSSAEHPTQAVFPDSSGTGDRPTQAVSSRDRPTQGVSSRDRPTQSVSPGDRPTQAVSSGDRPTQGVSSGDRPTSGDRSASGDRPTSGDRSSGDRPTQVVDEKALGGRETVKVPGPRRPPDAERRSHAPLPVAAAFATIWAALLSYLPVAAVIGLARTLEGQGGLGGAAHAGLAGWMLGHGVPVGTSIGSLSLAPLLLTLLVGWRLNRAGLHVTRAIGVRHSGRVGDALLVSFAIALTYSLLGSVLGLVVDGRHTEVSAGHAAINFFVLGMAGSLLGSLRGTDALSTIARAMPGAIRHGVRTGLVAALFVLAAGAAVTGLAVAVDGGTAADMISAYRTGVAGQAGITLLSLAYGANAVIWSSAYLLGPGFALGAGSAIRLTEVTVGAQPMVPLLAGLPNGPMGAAGALLLAVPVLAGIAAGWLLTLRLNRDGLDRRDRDRRDRDRGDRDRRDRDGRDRDRDDRDRDDRDRDTRGRKGGRDSAAPALPSWRLVLGSAVLAGPAAGVVLGLLAKISSGSLGDGRMAVIGPDVWQTGFMAALVVAVSAAVGAAACRTFGPAPKG